MSIDLKVLDELRGRGVARATFHPDGSLATVEFGTLTSDEDKDQRDQQPGPKRRSVVGGLIPRVASDS